MCGIIGIAGQSAVADRLLESLRRLEYRGYDSAGIATLVDGRIERRRAEGKIDRLAARLAEEPLAGTTGIGHTRWATHGAPSEANAHPHATDRLALVHNGIIENHAALRKELIARGHRFSSETDTEVAAVLITDLLAGGASPKDAVAAALKRLEGAFALAIVFVGKPGLIIVARRGSPLALGFGQGETYIGSDAMALAPLSRRIAYLEEGDWAEVTPDGATIYDEAGRVVARPVRMAESTGALVGKGNYRHFMLKEIHEQPVVLGDTLKGCLALDMRLPRLPPLAFKPEEATRWTLIGCGTAHYASRVAKYWLEELAQVPVESELASEFRYRRAPLDPKGIALFVSQSGETADTLAALRHCKANGLHTIGVVNVPESSIAREVEVSLPTNAGPEIGVASTKAFTTQLAVMATLAIAIGLARRTIDEKRARALAEALIEVPARMTEVLARAAQFRTLAQTLAAARDVIYLGRGTCYPLALEGALKLKEVSYIHAEGYAAGELKHGPIALIDDVMPVVVLAPPDHLYEKTASNVEEVIARGAKVIFISDARGAAQFKDRALATVEMPDVDPFAAPFLYALPVQLLAYYTAVLRGTDVDQPRNLAKSVTVE
ncbi:MAG: glutamine--fructose-6-phosphate transaminase (isomerizing) [Alphaproteobacteria bacterium]|nr:glutamine--fructose-6-phosphate transaminase (isomerizing) [Alphaproteobacteria bacterium]